MRFLADESCDFAIVRALREVGHDVTAVAEISPRAEDPEVVDLAANEQRLLTEEKNALCLRLAAAVKLFELGRLSSGAAAKLAGIPRTLFLTKLEEYGVPALQLTEEELRRDSSLG